MEGRRRATRSRFSEIENVYPTRVFKRRELLQEYFKRGGATFVSNIHATANTGAQAPSPRWRCSPAAACQTKGGRRGLGSGRGGRRHLRCMGHTGAGWSDARSSTVKERNPHLACLTRVMSNQSSSEPISPSVRGSHRVCCAAGVLCCWGAGAGERAGYPEPNDHSPHCQRRGLG